MIPAKTGSNHRRERRDSCMTIFVAKSESEHTVLRAHNSYSDPNTIEFGDFSD